MDSSYQQEQLHDGNVRFTVTPASAPKVGGTAKGIGLLLLGPAALPALMINKKAESKTAAIRQAGGTFVVSPNGIDKDGSFIPVNQLNRLILRNSFIPESNPNSVFIYNPNSFVSSSLATAALFGEARRNETARVSFTLCVEHQGVSTILAGGMTETTAIGLMQDVGRILNL